MSLPPELPATEPARRERQRFRETALASGLVEESQLAAAEASLAGVLQQGKATPADWDEAVADRLVQDKLLTPFQAREMLAGRRRFRLGQYTVLDEVARGGMGQVFKAEHAMMGREVAVKVLPRAKSTPESEAAFRREMRMLGRLDHENLVRAFDAGYDAMVYYLVTELVPGLDLKRHVQKQGPLNEMVAASVISQAARGLAHAHQEGLVHRDVKPGNLLVMHDGRVKVLDLGLAGSQIEEESSRLGRVVGTMDYIAPEQIRAPDDVGPSADIYALGCTLYYAVSGQVPFPGGTRREKMQRHLSAKPTPIAEIAPHLSGEFCRVIEAMMAKDPAERIASAGEVVERLRRWSPDVLATLPRQGFSASGDRSPGEPPPLHEHRPHGLPWPAAGDGSEASTALPFDQLLPKLVQWFRTQDFLRILRAVPNALVVATVVGLLFGVVMYGVRQFEPGEFDKLMDKLMLGASPSALGLGAFLLLFVLQLVATASAGRRRRR